MSADREGKLTLTLSVLDWVYIKGTIEDRVNAIVVAPGSARALSPTFEHNTRMAYSRLSDAFDKASVIYPD